MKSKKISINIFALVLIVFSLIAVSGLVSYTVTNFASNGNIFNQTRFENSTNIHLEIPDNATRYMYAGATADYVYKNNHQFNNTFAFSFWFNRVGATAFANILRQTDAAYSSVNNRWRLTMDGAGTGVNFWATNDTGGACVSGTSIGTATANTWEQWLVTYNGTRYEVYKNGANVLNADCNVNMSNLVYPVEMGRVVAGYDDLIFYNEYLNSTQVSNIYNNGRFIQLNLPSITDYYSFNGNASNWSNSGPNTTALTTSGSPRTLPDETNTNNPIGSYLLAYYSFDADNTNPNWTTGIINNSLGFEKSTDYITVGSSLNNYINISTDYSMMAWFYTSSTSTSQSIFENYISSTNRNGISLAGGAGVRCSFYNGSYYSATGTFSANTWTHVVYNHYSNGSIDCYVNAVGNSTIINSGSLGGIVGATIGYTTNNPNFNGRIDMVRAFNRTLSATEIANIYSNESMGVVDPNMNRTGLVGEWALNESGANFTTQDSSGLENHGTLVGFQPSTTAYDLTNNNYDGTYGDILYAGSSPYNLGIYGAGLSGSTLTLPTTLDDAMVNGFTYSVWARKDGNSSGSTTQISLLGNYYSGTPLVVANIAGNNRVNFFLGDSPSRYNLINTSEGAVNLGEWNHYVFTYNGTISNANSLKMYMNGVEVGTNSQVGGVPTGSFVTANNLWIGYTGSGGQPGGFLNGSVDEVMIFSKALNSTEVSEIYNNQSKRFKTEGTVGFSPIGLNESANAINISLNNAQTNFGTSLQTRAGYWNENMGYNLGTEGEVVFDGNGDYVLLNNEVNLTANTTLMGWIYRNSNGLAIDCLFGGIPSPNWMPFCFNQNTNLVSIYNGTWLYSTGTVPKGSWRHVAQIWNGTHVIIYINGVYDSAISNTNTGQKARTIGSSSSSATYFVNGSIDEVMIFNRTLNSTEIQNIYNQNRSFYNGNTSGLVSYYTFDNYKSFYSDSLGLNNGTKVGDTKISLSNVSSLATGLVGYWPGDGNANDYLGLNNGILQNGATANTSGVYNNSFGLDGVNGRTVNISGVPSTAEALSISLWYKIKGDKTLNTLVSRGPDGDENFELTFTNTRLFGLIFENLTGTRSGPSNLNIGAQLDEWENLVVIYSGSLISIYRNGILITTSTIVTGNLKSNTSNIFIGTDNAMTGRTFNGSIDDVMIWNRSLSADEIKEIYNKGLANWNYGNWKIVSEGNVSLTLPINATTIRLEYKLFDGTAEGWYTPYLDSSTLRLVTDSGGISTSASYATGTTETGGYNQSFITANISTTPEDLVSSVIVYLYNSSGVRNSSAIESPYFVNFTNLQNDRYYLNATVSFSTGETSTLTTRTIYLDAIVPNATLITPIDDNKTNQTSVNFTANITDNLGIANYTLNIYNDTSNTLWTSITNTTSNFFGQTTTQTIGTVVGVVEGFFTWFYQVFDLAGNVFTTNNNSLNVSYLPQIQIISPLNTTYYISDTSSEITINFTATDGNGVSNLWFYNTSSNQNVSYFTSVASSYNLGQNNITFYANDTLGDLNSTTRYFTLSSLQLHSISNAISSPQEYEQIIVYVNVTNYNLGSLNCDLSGDLGTFSNSSSGSGNFNLSFNTGLKSAGTYSYTVTCDNDIEPGIKSLSSSVTVTKQTDLYPSSISISPTSPDVGENVTITANVQSPFRANTNVYVEFIINGTVIGNSTIASINADSSAPAIINYIFTTDGYIPIKVVVNPTRSINESSYSNNNMTRAFPVGFDVAEGGINLTGLTISPNPVNQYNIFNVAGYATYDFSGNPAVIGGTVNINIEGDENVYSTSTNDNGFFNYSGILALNDPNNYSIEVYISDGAVSGIDNTSLELQIIAQANSTTPNFLASDLVFNNSYPYVNEIVSINSTIRNIGGVSGNVTASLYRGSILLAEQNVTVSSGGAYYWANEVNLSSAGNNYFTLALDVANITNDTSRANNNRTENIYAYTNISELAIYAPYLALSETQIVAGVPINITAYLLNSEGLDATNVVVNFYNSGTLINSTTVPLVRKFSNGSSTTTITYTFSTSGTKNISYSINPSQIILENSYSNNNYTSNSFSVAASASPDFSVQDITIASPNFFSTGADQNIFVDTTLNATLYVKNIGSGNSSDSINVSFYVGGNYTNSSIITGLNKDQQKTVSFPYSFSKEEILTGQTKTISAIVNPANSTPETSYTNNQRVENFKLVMPELHIADAQAILNTSLPLINTSVEISVVISNLDSNIDAKNILIQFNDTAEDTNITTTLGTVLVNISANDIAIASYIWQQASPEGRHTILVTANPLYQNYERSASSPWNYNAQGNSKSSALTVDSGAPTISNITLNYTTESHSFTNDIDPRTLIIFTANVTDYNGVSSVIFQYANASSWTNITMNNITNQTYTANFTTASTDANYTYRIFANDTTSRVRITDNQTFNSSWDCTWNLTTNTLGPEGFFGGYKTLGIINISNNGDANYSNGDGCIIKFGRNSAGSSWYTTDTISLNFSQDYLFESVLSGYSSQMGLRYYINNTEVTSTNLSQRENLSLEVKGFFPSADEILTEYPTFNISSNITDTYYNRNTEVITATMIITPGAYLINEITSPSTSEYFVDLYNVETYNFSTYVRNVVDGSTDPNNVAYNVSLNWTIPQELTSISGLIVSDNLTFFNETLNDTARRYLNFSLVLNSNTLASITNTNTTYSVYTYAYGYENSTGNLTLINQGANGTISDSFILRFFCSQTSSLALSPACQPVTITTPGSSSSGGGGGGGGGGAGSLAIKTEATFELVRGEKQEFQLPIINAYPNPKKNVNITINGIESKYIEISPKTISSIPGNSSKNITVKITAPAYFSQNASIIEFEIKGSVDTGNNTYSFTETKFVRLIILEFSRNQALKYINESKDNIQKMNNSKLILKKVQESYSEMLKNYEYLDFISLKENYDLISKISNSAFESRDLIAELKDSIEEAEFRGIEVVQTKKLLFAAETLFERGEYILALEKLKEAKITFAIETKGEFNLFYEIKNNPLRYFGILIGISALGLGTTLATRYKYLKNKLRVLDDESQLLVQLMKVVQKECFEQNKMSMDEYQSAMYQYEKRLTETVEERISAETKLANLMSIHGEISAISQEKKRILGLMEKLQEDYLKKGAIETRLYESMMKIYSTRIMKLDEELAMFEAKEFLKKGK